MDIQVVETSRQILVNNVPIEAIIGAIALFVAFISLLIAIRSSQETARANILQYLPVITLDYDFDNDKVILKNIGRGSAVDVVLDKYYNWSANKDFKMYGLSTMVFEKVNILDSGKSVKVDKNVKGLPDTLGILTYTIFSQHTKHLSFIIKFRDISGKKYYTVVNVKRGKVEVSRFPRSLNIRTFLTLTYLKSLQFILTIVYFVIVKYKKFIDNKS